MFPGLDQIRRRSAVLRLWGQERLPASELTLEFGRGKASIVAGVCDDGRALLRLGSGEEFAGPCDEMPLAVVRGARQALTAAGDWSRTMLRGRRTETGGPVRVVVTIGDEVRGIGVNLAELRDRESVHADLWAAFTAWLGPLLVVLFGDAPDRPGQEDSPALSRARALCR